MNKHRHTIAFFVLLVLMALLVLTACSTDIDTPSHSAPPDSSGNTYSNTTSYATDTSTPSQTAIPSPTAKPTVRACVKAHSLSVRTGPGTEHEVVDYLSEGDCITLQSRSEDGNWVKFEFGWVAIHYLDFKGSSFANLSTNDSSSTEGGRDTTIPASSMPGLVENPCVPRNTKRERAEVYRVIDGDTIEVLLHGKVYDVRYIGINTPETDQPFGGEATQKNKSLLSSGEVLLVKDVSETDRYGRLLRYVISNGVFVNKALVEEGYAQASTYPPDVTCSNTFKEAQEVAREKGSGIWASYGEESETTSNNCHPSYPTVCIPPPPPDLDCADISYHSFTVTGSDPHRFDGDSDGVGCESAGSSSGGSAGDSGSSGNNCHPSYPGVCIPPPPPDLDCGQISYSNFRVTGSDPHRFDGDHDGIGCER